MRRVFHSTTLAAALVAALGAGSGAAFAQAPKAVTVDAARGQQLAGQVCAACHGADGNSTAVTNPKLASQHADYTFKQLQNFRPKAANVQPERPNPIMTGIASTLSEQDMRDLAAYYATQPLKPAVAKNKETVELGQRIYRAGIGDKGVPACAGCHAANGAGIPAQYPRLQGQWAEYHEAQLVAFRQGARKNSVQMTAIASRMSDLEIKAVSDYMAGLR
jgi:cytochrome c553